MKTVRVLTKHERGIVGVSATQRATQGKATARRKGGGRIVKDCQGAKPPLNPLLPLKATKKK